MFRAITIKNKNIQGAVGYIIRALVEYLKDLNFLIPTPFRILTPMTSQFAKGTFVQTGDWEGSLIDLILILHEVPDLVISRHCN